MSKIICDVCGTAFPENTAQCPICGSDGSFAVAPTEEEQAAAAAEAA